MIVMYIHELWVKANRYTERNTPPFIMCDERFHANYRKYGCKRENYLGIPLLYCTSR